jgi:hypothetical protein
VPAQRALLDRTKAAEDGAGRNGAAVPADRGRRLCLLRRDLGLSGRHRDLIA